MGTEEDGILLGGKLTNKSEKEIGRELVEAYYAKLVKKRQRHRVLRLAHRLGIHSWVLITRDPKEEGELKAQRCYFCKKWRTTLYRERQVLAAISGVIGVGILYSISIIGIHIQDSLLSLSSLSTSVLAMWALVRYYWGHFVNFEEGKSTTWSEEDE